MNRRAAVYLACAVLAVPRLALGQTRMRRVGFIATTSPLAELSAFVCALTG